MPQWPFGSRQRCRHHTTTRNPSPTLYTRTQPPTLARSLHAQNPRFWSPVRWGGRTHIVHYNPATRRARTYPIHEYNIYIYIYEIICIYTGRACAQHATVVILYYINVRRNIYNVNHVQRSIYISYAYNVIRVCAAGVCPSREVR